MNFVLPQSCQRQTTHSKTSRSEHPTNLNAFKVPRTVFAVNQRWATPTRELELTPTPELELTPKLEWSCLDPEWSSSGVGVGTFFQLRLIS
jgi:hypothetical protein